MKIIEITDNQNIQIKALLKSISYAVAKNGNEYTRVEVADKSGSITGNVWSVVNGLKAGDIVDISGRGNLYNGKMTLSVSNITPGTASESELAEILPASPYGADSMWRSVENMIASMTNEAIRTLTTAILSDVRESFIKVAGAKSFHHAGVHGLLQHTAEMARTAEAIAPIYPVLNKDLLVAGTILHDLSKIDEYVFDSNGIATDISVEGELFGHVFLGAEKVREYGRRLGISEDVIIPLAHMVASHHGNLEWGAVQKPCTPEAAALWLIDMISARMEMFRVEYETLQPGQMSPNKNLGLDGIRVYRPNIQ